MPWNARTLITNETQSSDDDRIIIALDLLTSRTLVRLLITTSPASTEAKGELLSFFAFSSALTLTPTTRAELAQRGEKFTPIIGGIADNTCLDNQ
jgi:hypothetical protein